MNTKDQDLRGSLDGAPEGLKISASPLRLLLPGHKVCLKLHAENVGNSSLYVTRVGVQFQWQRESRRFFYVNCDYHLTPDSTAEFPELSFETPVDKLGHFKYDFILCVKSGKEGRTPKVLRTPGGIIEVTTPIIPFAKAFISYSNKNLKAVTRLSELLENNGIVAYIAERFPEFGRDVQKKIYKKLDDADFVVALLTPSSLRSEWVRLELKYAKRKDYRVIPILREGTCIRLYSHLLGKDLAVYLDNLEWVSFDGYDIRECAQKLIPLLRQEKVQEYRDFADKEKSLVELVDEILGEGVVLEADTRVSLVGIELLILEARVVVAGVDTFLKYAEAVGLTAVET